MLQTNQILASAIGLTVCVASLAGCGQKGTLFLPTEPAAAHRATLPQSLRPSFSEPPATSASEPASAVTPAPGK